MIYLVDARGVIVVAATVRAAEPAGIDVRYDTAPLDVGHVIGPTPKGVTRHALRFARDGVRWSCSVVIDI